MSDNASVKWEYLTKFPVNLKAAIESFIESNPIDENGKKMSYNKVINLAVESYLNVK